MYNVLTEPWIAVMDKRGNRLLVSMMDIFQNSKEYADLCFSLNMVNSSVLVFLVNFVTDAYLAARAFNCDDEEDEDEIETKWWPSASDDINLSIIKEYIKKCEAEGVSFDLFDPIKPFFQMPGDLPKKAMKRPIGIIDPCCATGNNSKVFDNPEKHTKSPGECLSLLIASARYAPNNGGCSSSGNINGEDLLFIMRKGENLQQTIIMNIMRRGRNEIDGDNYGYGIPWYRCMDEIDSEKEFPDVKIGWLNGTFFLRTMYRLILDDDGLVRTTWQAYALGKETKRQRYPTWVDPYQLYLINEKRPEKYIPGQSMCYNALNMYEYARSDTENIFKITHNDVVAEELDNEDVQFTVFGQRLIKGSLLVIDAKEDMVIKGMIFSDLQRGEYYRVAMSEALKFFSNIQKGSDALNGVLMKNLCDVFKDSPDMESKSACLKKAISDYVSNDFSQQCRTFFESYILHDCVEDSRKLAEVGMADGQEWNIDFKNNVKQMVMKSFDDFVFAYSCDAMRRIKISIARNELEETLNKKLFGKKSKKKENT